MRQLLIVGIDPGTTLGYAILDIDGNFVMAGSSRELNIEQLTLLLIRHGKPLIIGCDKNPAPRFVEKVAIKMGAKLFYPVHDLGTVEKKQATKSYGIRNSHQMDALAGAIFAYRDHKGLFDKIHAYLKHRNLLSLKNEVTELVIKKDDLSISAAVEQLLRPEIKIQQVMEKQAVTKVHVKENALEDENRLLKQKIGHLQKEIAELKSMDENLKKRILHLHPDEKFRSQLRFKEERILSVSSQLAAKDEVIKTLNEEIALLNSYLADIQDFVLLKKLKNLGSQDFETANKILKIRKGDILLVEYPNEFSPELVEKLKSKVQYIVTERKASLKHFLFIDAKKVVLNESRYFALADKKQFEKERSQLDILGKIVSEYKEKRI
jgi:predicted RNase H-like nuclease (RuvC/YqgF family)